MTEVFIKNALNDVSNIELSCTRCEFITQNYFDNYPLINYSALTKIFMTTK